MKLNEIYAIRQGKDGIRYGATGYRAKPGYSSECQKIDGKWTLNDGTVVPGAYTATQQKAIEIFFWCFIITIIFLWICY